MKYILMIVIVMSFIGCAGIRDYKEVSDKLNTCEYTNLQYKLDSLKSHEVIENYRIILQTSKDYEASIISASKKSNDLISMFTTNEKTLKDSLTLLKDIIETYKSNMEFYVNYYQSTSEFRNTLEGKLVDSTATLSKNLVTCNETSNMLNNSIEAYKLNIKSLRDSLTNTFSYLNNTQNTLTITKEQLQIFKDSLSYYNRSNDRINKMLDECHYELASERTNSRDLRSKATTESVYQRNNQNYVTVEVSCNPRELRIYNQITHLEVYFNTSGNMIDSRGDLCRGLNVSTNGLSCTDSHFGISGNLYFDISSRVGYFNYTNGCKVNITR